MKKTMSLLLALAIALSGALTGCSEQTQTQEEEAPSSPEAVSCGDASSGKGSTPVESSGTEGLFSPQPEKAGMIRRKASKTVKTRGYD